MTVQDHFGCGPEKSLQCRSTPSGEVLWAAAGCLVFSYGRYVAA